jgi:23S rRNA G2445 N2-methylase RlmL
MLDVIVTCARATSAAVAHELTALGAENVVAHDAAVSCRGDWRLIARANLFLRCASRVLVRLTAADGVVDEDAALTALERARAPSASTPTPARRRRGGTRSMRASAPRT